MKRLGTVLNVSAPRGLIVRGDKPKLSESKLEKKVPKLNSVVLNKSVKQIGKISGIIGPVDHPYIYVKLLKGADPKQQTPVGERVYAL